MIAVANIAVVDASAAHVKEKKKRTLNESSSTIYSSRLESPYSP